MSQKSDHTASANGASGAPYLCAAAGFITFKSSATDLLQGFTDNKNASNCFLFDRVNQTIECVSLESAGNAASEPSQDPFVTAGGQYICFSSRAPDIDLEVGTPSDGNGEAGVFRLDRQKRKARLVSLSTAGVAGSDRSNNPTCIGDGRHVVFNSLAPEFWPGDVPGTRHVFVRDVDRSQTTWQGSQVSVGGSAHACVA